MRVRVRAVPTRQPASAFRTSLLAFFFFSNSLLILFFFLFFQFADAFIFVGLWSTIARLRCP